MTKKDLERRKKHLRILGLKGDADIERIQAAYRRLVFFYHPDRNRKPGASDRFREVVEAYGSLMEEEQIERVRTGSRIIERVRTDSTVGKLSLEELEHRIRYSDSPMVRASAVAAAGMSGVDGSSRLLMDALEDGDECVVNVAVKMLVERGEARSIGPLLLRGISRRNTAGFRAACSLCSRLVGERFPKRRGNWRWRISFARGWAGDEALERNFR
jgi:hypothetical protein